MTDRVSEGFSNAVGRLSKAATRPGGSNLTALIPLKVTREGRTRTPWLGEQVK